MHDGKALQGGTSHNFGDGFAKAFDIQYLDKDNTLKYCHQTSWGVSTRIIGAIIMTHGDDNGLVLPPAVAPIQVVVIPCAQHKPGVIEKATEVLNTVNKFARAKIDISDNSPGWKYAEYEMKGVPVRLEIGPRDIEANQCVLVRRDTREKKIVSLDALESEITALLADITAGLYNKASENRRSKTYTETELDSFIETAKSKPGYIRAHWCGDLECELKLKELADVTSRCMPFGEQDEDGKCICCGKPTKKLVYWGKAY
jgi:prolyl-tRNA synthetase